MQVCYKHKCIEDVSWELKRALLILNHYEYIYTCLEHRKEMLEKYFSQGCFLRKVGD